MLVNAVILNVRRSWTLFYDVERVFAKHVTTLSKSGRKKTLTSRLHQLKSDRFKVKKTFDGEIDPIWIITKAIPEHIRQLIMWYMRHCTIVHRLSCFGNKTVRPHVLGVDRRITSYLFAIAFIPNIQRSARLAIKFTFFLSCAVLWSNNTGTESSGHL